MTVTRAAAALPQVLSAYQTALRRAAAQAPEAAQAQAAATAPRFEAFLKAEVEGAAKDLRTGETRSIQALSGKADLQQVVEAVTQAELSLQKVTAVRDRVIAAYQEIIRMPI